MPRSLLQIHTPPRHQVTFLIWLHIKHSQQARRKPSEIALQRLEPHQNRITTPSPSLLVEPKLTTSYAKNHYPLDPQLAPFEMRMPPSVLLTPPLNGTNSLQRTYHSYLAAIPT
ncbi:hypothetical protein Salat_1127800 [Sesamum alatum]|uniref:Uncharacterized protein n=1 Tax=Sesamum alatum TaxID=300844 RepID=A0AAE2CN37_9LAMI|nr:hypothetical protein Salat_1127800 [Sesamum alatum]